MYFVVKNIRLHVTSFHNFNITYADSSIHNFIIYSLVIISFCNVSLRFVFIKPPSMEVLEERLRARGTETEESLAKVKIQRKRETEKDRKIEKEPLEERLQGRSIRGIEDYMCKSTLVHRQWSVLYELEGLNL